MDNTNTEVSRPGIVEQAATTDKVLSHMKEFTELKTKLLDQNDIALISKKAFIKRSGWRKLALAFNISDEIVKEAKGTYEDHYVWRIWTKTTAPNGRYTVGIGACSSNEKVFTHGEHDVYSTAHTRSKNRALSDLLGSGEISAEELSETKEKEDEPYQEHQEHQTINRNAGVELRHNIRWAVKDSEYPIPVDAPPYKGLLGKQIIPRLQQKHDIRLFEETSGNNVVSIRTSDMQQEQYDVFANALTWAIQKIAECKRDDVKVWVEDSQK